MSTSTAALHTRTTQPEAELPAWKSELNAKLEAHRQRRGLGSELLQDQATPQRRESDGHDRSSRASAARVAAKVAERYASAPSYSEVLAANAAAAAAAAEMAVAAAAAAQAHQVAHQAAHDLFSDLADRESARQAACDDQSMVNAPDSTHPESMHSVAMQATIEHPHPLPLRPAIPERAAATRTSEIVDAFAEAEVSPAMQLPAKLIEFPRELIAVRKSRPRIAEGPLAETPLLFDQEGDEPQPELPSLRIFEVQGRADQAVEAGTEATRPVMEEYPPARRQESRYDELPARAPQWQSIRLGEHPLAHPASSQEEVLRHRSRQPEVQPAKPLHVASLLDRGMAALVDFAVATAAFLLFVLVFASCTAHPPLDKAALASAGVIFVAFLVFYQWLFLSYGGETLGMRYARIALCTFDDENPTRPMLRRRLWASLLAALPLGLGLVWAVFDEDALGWHDRMTRTYQRSYQ